MLGRSLQSCSMLDWHSSSTFNLRSGPRRLQEAAEHGDMVVVRRGSGRGYRSIVYKASRQLQCCRQRARTRAIDPCLARQSVDPCAGPQACCMQHHCFCQREHRLCQRELLDPYQLVGLPVRCDYSSDTQSTGSSSTLMTAVRLQAGSWWAFSPYAGVLGGGVAGRQREPEVRAQDGRRCLRRHRAHGHGAERAVPAAKLRGRTVCHLYLSPPEAQSSVFDAD